MSEHPSMRDHRRLEVWLAAVGLARLVYSATEQLPDDERFGVTAQMRRASFSVLSNIAEGAARHSQKDFARFLDVAAGSSGELMGQSEAVIELSLGPRALFEAVLEQAERTKRMLHGLMKTVRSPTG